MSENDQIIRLMRKLRFRLGQAHRIAQAAETCAIEGCHDRSKRLLEEVEELTRDAGHLVQASMIVSHPDMDITEPAEIP